MPGKHRNRTSYASTSRVPGQRLSGRERTQILTLFHTAKWPKRAIAKELRIGLSIVCLTVARGVFTPPQQIGCRSNITTRKRKRLVERATQDALHRRMPYEEIASIEGINACRRSLTAAFEKKRYHRRSATAKPLLTEKHKEKRLA